MMGEHYPQFPGFKETETSREAAERMDLRAGSLRRRTYEYICANPDNCADEIAAGLCQTVLAIRPRVSELRTMGMIEVSGRGRNRSGMSAHRWRAVTPKGDV